MIALARKSELDVGSPYPDPDFIVFMHFTDSCWFLISSDFKFTARGSKFVLPHWAQIALAVARAISGPKKVSTFRAQPFKYPS